MFLSCVCLSDLIASGRKNFSSPFRFHHEISHAGFFSSRFSRNFGLLTQNVGGGSGFSVAPCGWPPAAVSKGGRTIRHEGGFEHVDRGSPRTLRTGARNCCSNVGAKQAEEENKRVRSSNIVLYSLRNGPLPATPSLSCTIRNASLAAMKATDYKASLVAAEKALARWMTP